MSCQKAKTASEGHWLVTFQSARQVRTKPPGHDGKGRAYQNRNSLGRVIGFGTSQQSARADTAQVHSGRPPTVGSRPSSFGINPPVGKTTERGLSARLLSNKTTRPIHLDMHRAPTTTFAESPYNGFAVQRRPHQHQGYALTRMRGKRQSYNRSERRLGAASHDCRWRRIHGKSGRPLQPLVSQLVSMA
jgi:hypothetical protein